MERHAAYAQSFSAKVAEQQRQEDELHCSSGRYVGGGDGGDGGGGELELARERQ